MEYGQNTTYVQYVLTAAPAEVKKVGSLALTLTPFCVYRSHHATTHGDANWHFLVENQEIAAVSAHLKKLQPARLLWDRLPTIPRRETGIGV